MKKSFVSSYRWSIHATEIARFFDYNDHGGMVLDKFHERLNILYERERDKDPGCGRRQFAKRCKISFHRIDNYLSGRGLPDIDTFRIVAESLHVNPLWLLGFSEEECVATELYPYMKGLKQKDSEKIIEYIEFLIFKNSRSSV